MPSVMLDTNVYRDAAYRERATKIRSVVFSSVVVQELLVIANEQQQASLIREFRERISAGTGFVPDHNDWIEVGRCLYRLHHRGIADFAKLGKPEVNMLVRDALIARTAIRAKALLVTLNTSDFSKIKAIFASLKFVSPAEFFVMRPR
jgi:predicted nucleic acid-binding protein